MRGGLIWCPWAGALARGQTGLAALLLLLQASVIFWPLAISRARRLERRCKIQNSLDRVAAHYALPHETGRPGSTAGTA